MFGKRDARRPGTPGRRYRSGRAPEDRFGHARRGRRPDLGAPCFRSSWEANYARYLTFLVQLGLIARWEYEPETFVFPGVHFGPRLYTPDFKVTLADGTVVYHEVKGWLDPESRCKLRRLRRCYPEVILIVIGPKEYAAVAQWAAVIGTWE